MGTRISPIVLSRKSNNQRRLVSRSLRGGPGETSHVVKIDRWRWLSADSICHRSGWTANDGFRPLPVCTVAVHLIGTAACKPSSHSRFVVAAGTFSAALPYRSARRWHRLAGARRQLPVEPAVIPLRPVSFEPIFPRQGLPKVEARWRDGRWRMIAAASNMLCPLCSGHAHVDAEYGQATS